MIKANELMIGNKIISCLTKEEVTVDWLIIKHIADGNYQNFYDNNPVYKPIPLTEDWLLKFGLTKQRYGRVSLSYLFDMGTLIYDTDEKYWAYEVDTSHEGGYECTIATCHYVHQLQNLYFALTGTELTIKETAKP